MSSNIVMNKSQLRKLAREYALGNLEEDEYLRRRRTLVDDIVSGNVAIVREVPPPPPQAYSEDPTTRVSIGGRDRAQRLSPAALLIAIVIVAGVIWMIAPFGGQQGPNIEQPLQAPPVSRARLLIKDFVDERDFSAFSIASFKESWSHLTYAEKRDAYSARWFTDLINLISEEIEAQNALVGSEESITAAETGRRLSDFAAFLGISKYVTDFKGVPEQPVTPLATTEAAPSGQVTATANEPSLLQPAQHSAMATTGDEGPGIDPAPTATEISPEQAPQVPTNNSASETRSGIELASLDEGVSTDSEPVQSQAAEGETLAPVPDNEWLGAQLADAFTLQLFAANQLSEIQNLIAANPDVDLRLLVSTRNAPRYRVVYGLFDSEAAARGAYAALPESIRQAQPVPLVKSIGSLRNEIGGFDKIAVVDAGQYTLQVFATDSADSARRLQADYPALKLSLLETTNPYSRYRLLYGLFDSEETAKQAAGELPLELLQNVGNPLIKTVSELQAVKR